MNTTVIPFNANDPSGRAIVHILETSSLLESTIKDGIEFRQESDGSRTLIVHPSFSARCSSGEASLLLVIESLAGLGNVNLLWLMADLDTQSRRAICDAMFIAAGFRGATIVSVL